MGDLPHVCGALAVPARDLLIAFALWCDRPEQASMVRSDEWTMLNMIDAFLMEAGANGDLRIRAEDEE